MSHDQNSNATAARWPHHRSRPRRKRHVPLFSNQGTDVWLPRRPKKGRKLQTSYVYLFVHRSENRFKIGMSIKPRERLAKLPEAFDIDEVKSLVVVLPDPKRASQIEIMLHKALSGYRLTRLNWIARVEANIRDDGHDGETEWFSLTGFRHAIQILRAVPGEGTNSEGLELQTLNGSPYWLDHRAGLTPKQECWQEAENFNLERIEEIAETLMVISRRLKIRWWAKETVQSPSEGDARPAGNDSIGTLCIEGLKQAWDPDMLKARFEVVSSSLWELKTGRLKGQPKIIALVKVLRYSVKDPNRLELVFNSLDSFRKIPAGEVVARRVRAMLQGYKLRGMPE